MIGPYRGPSGYDRHTRELVRNLVKLGIRVKLTALDGWSAPLPPELRDSWFDTLTAPVDADTALHFTMPNHVRMRPARRNVNYTMFEAERIPASWAAAAAHHDMIVVPTESSRLAWRNGGVAEEKVRICPLGVDGRYFSESVEPLNLQDAAGRPLTDYACRFLNVAELRPRKNHVGLLRCWILATHRTDDAVLILKVTAFQNHLFALFERDVTVMQERLGRSLADAAPVVLLPNLLSDDRLRALYHTATHYISLSKGEGWDQAMMEACAAGLSAIAPRHSAYTEYLRNGDAELIPSKLAPAEFEGEMGREDRLWFEGLCWWQPDEDIAVDTIRRAVRDPGSSLPGPQARLVREYTWEKAAAKLIAVLGITPS